MKLRYLAIAFCALLSGCERPANYEAQRQQEMYKQYVNVTISDRVKVERIAIVGDTTAYGSTRGVYVITDTKTGQEFIGVSGIGIAETGSHSSGKTTTSDER